MPQQNIISKNFNEFGGVDYRSNSVSRKARFSADAKNVFYLRSNSLSNRSGNKGCAKSAGGGGTKKFTWLDSEGTSYKELITIDDNLHRKKTGTISITYTGAEDNVILTIFPEEISGVKTYWARLIESETEVFSLDLGVGVNEASPVTISDLVTAINAEADYTCSLTTGDGTGPAAFIDSQTLSLVTSVAGSISFDYWEQIYCPVSDPFSTFFSNVSGANGELAALFNHANRFFIATGFNELFKYDSVQTFRAGMPYTESLSAATTGTGITGDYEWFITYEQTDALGHIVEGDESNHATLTLANQTGRLTIPQIQPTTGFLTSCALANNGGTETGATLTVDDGSGGAHTLQEGQTVFFVDNSGNEIEDIITGTTSTTITFANSYTIADNAIISAGLKINIWRNINGSTELFYLVDTIANNSFVATVTYDDATADATLETNAEYQFPVEGHGLPPANMKYLASYGGLLQTANSLADVWFSDLDGPEYFNTSFRINSKSNSPITAIAANKDALYVFKKNETHGVTGDLSAGTYRAQYISTEIGCSSYHSIIDIDSSLWFHSADYGPRRIISTQLPDDISFRVSPVLTRTAPNDDQVITHERVIAYNLRSQQICLFFFPTETEVSGDVYPNNNSFILAADYRAQYEEDVEYDDQGKVVQRVPKIRWWPWDNLNLGGGGDELEGVNYFTEKRYSDINLAMEYPLCKFLETNSEYDYHDHAQGYDWYNDSPWLDLNEPDVLKKINKISLYNLAQTLASSFTLTASTQVNYLDGITHSQKTVEFGEGGGVSSGYGSGPWGDFAWGDSVIPKKIFPLRRGKFTSIRLRLEASVWLQRIAISGWAYECVPAFRSKITK